MAEEDINKLSADDALEETRNEPDTSEVYEESEEGIAYTPNNPGSEQQTREAKKILEKENRNEQA